MVPYTTYSPVFNVVAAYTKSYTLLLYEAMLLMKELVRADSQKMNRPILVHIYQTWFIYQRFYNFSNASGIKNYLLEFVGMLWAYLSCGPLYMLKSKK